MEEFLDEKESKERTFVLIKPDGVQRGFVGKIIRRFEEKGFQLSNLKMTWASEDKMKQHSIHLKTRPFFKSYIKYMTSGPVILMVWEGRNAIRAARLLIGETFPHNCSPKMIRGEFSLYVRRGIIHGSDSMEAASREIELWFGDESPIPIFRM
ncbi:nucleoside diphosphate kinase A-like isoform X1 [Belonocnema kinseyi]|uniref:nucleoside diphosphate kinase A-like isoform X1 n=1 Tax=Belonocnema kinseyi TaxID=2817044 RepID=UPI00143CE24F|nr:nucleoside diphosphate kinase A-like isoform X1 [Belonocnema kinseyi]XP_033223015.1 nucleoside diphosphate kinase A-like isoform X1 [Belonocnema kinseyi]XP_033223016.1 nucleoside diphosphate kinase A-like isoform X1 [Belonocnema kinseyi]XP_033223017.1 nucleoside diphosphate kinase A-like isoform X1 [Belonocnema kinseyi]